VGKRSTAPQAEYLAGEAAGQVYLSQYSADEGFLGAKAKSVKLAAG
jgi:hypothetical protein